jgi:hypothetical protein
LIALHWLSLFPLWLCAEHGTGALRAKRISADPQRLSVQAFAAAGAFRHSNTPRIAAMRWRAAQQSKVACHLFLLRCVLACARYTRAM